MEKNLSVQITLPKTLMFTASGGDQEQKASPPHLPENENGQEDSESQGYQRGMDHETQGFTFVLMLTLRWRETLL